MRPKLLFLCAVVFVSAGCGSQDDGGYTQADIDKAAHNPGAENMIGGEPMSRGQGSATPQQRSFGVGK